MSFGLWEDTEVPGENPRRHKENMQTPHRRAPVSQVDSNPEPSCCEAIVLAAAPPCHLRTFRHHKLLQLLQDTRQQQIKADSGQTRNRIFWGGYFYSHSILWGEKKTDTNGEIKELLEDSNLVCINDGRGTRWMCTQVAVEP